ncbi:HNH endonuclease [Mycolicibacterium moriokaense]|nr:HNH endonuclease [Mycolicibacterium moriokaense]
MCSSRDDIQVALDNFEAAFEAVASLTLDALTITEKKNVLVRLEAHRRRLPATEHPLINGLAAEGAPEALGGTSLAEVLTTSLRISKDEAKRRIVDAAELGPRIAFSGEPLEPVRPNIAKLQADGQIGAEHLKILRKFFKGLPDSVDVVTRDHAESHLAQVASELGPTELGKAADRMAYLLDQDGPEPTDADRARRRFLFVGKQQRDGMTPVRGLLDPETAATLEPVFAKWAAPGMCNPDDERPCVDGEPTPDAEKGDLRSPRQRNHDALKALARSALASGRLGQHNGLPVSIGVSARLEDLEAKSGHALTAGGTLLPMSDVIRMASHAYHYLLIFGKHTRVPLFFGRTRRVASPGQRIVLLSRDRGCTFPGCTVPGYGCQAHHGKRGWAKGGRTNIDEEVLACGPHNRLVEKGGWKTRIRKDGRVEWIPPPNLDHGQARVNDYHHPENYLLPKDDGE